MQKILLLFNSIRSWWYRKFPKRDVVYIRKLLRVAANNIERVV